MMKQHMVPVVVVLGLLVLHSRSTTAQGDTGALTAAQAAIACAPPPALELPRKDGLRVVGGQTSEIRREFSVRDVVVLSAGAGSGLKIGQRFFARRPVTWGDRSTTHPRVVRTAGWLRVTAVNEAMALASVEFTCVEISVGDYLDPFAVPVVPEGSDRTDTSGEPDFTALGKVVFGTDEKSTGGEGDFMIVDRGTQQQIVPGRRLAIYRDLKTTGLPLAPVGEAIVISAAPSTALIRITFSKDVVRTDDFIVPRKPAPPR